MCIRDRTVLYLSPSIQGSYDLNHIWAIHTGIRWNFANQTASIQVKANDRFNSMEGNIDVTLRNKGPVSYTHLDVYKRQPLTKAMSRK